MRKVVGAFVAAVLLLVGAAALPGPAGAQDAGEDDVLPIIFIHGFLGSGQQFEALALRFASNGYPEDYIEMFEHDSLVYGTGNNPDVNQQVWSRIDALVAELKERSGKDQVYLAGHSQGTFVSQSYLGSDPARAANVRKYVNLDGAGDVAGNGQLPGGVETLAIWGEGNDSDAVPGADNVHFSDQAHTQTVNSPETFAEMYEFFLGEPPELPDVVREPADEISVGGRVQLFPQNTGVTNASLQVYEVDGETGHRIDEEPEATFPLNANGDWGPFEADGEAFYEFALSRGPTTLHVYMQRFVRSSRWVRILTSEPGGLADSFWKLSDQHQNLVILRNKELWGDQGSNGDTLTVNGQSILSAATSPRSNRTIGIFVHDFNVDGVSDLSKSVSPTGIPFLTGVDLFLPAASPPDATTGIVATPRLGEGPESVCIPNYASTNDRASVVFASYHHLLEPDGSEAEGHANPTCAPPAVRQARPARPVPGRPSFTG